jgi:hypothetical protein
VKATLLLVLTAAGAAASACWTTKAQPDPVAPTPPPRPFVEARRTPPRASPCEQAVDHLAEIERDELSKIPDFADKLDALRDVTVASCDETHWSPELMACFNDTADTTALQQCQSLFTSDQTSDLMRRITEILTGLNGPP